MQMGMIITFMRPDAGDRVFFFIICSIPFANGRFLKKIWAEGYDAETFYIKRRIMLSDYSNNPAIFILIFLFMRQNKVGVLCLPIVYWWTLPLL